MVAERSACTGSSAGYMRATWEGGAATFGWNAFEWGETGLSETRGTRYRREMHEGCRRQPLARFPLLMMIVLYKNLSTCSIHYGRK